MKYDKRLNDIWKATTTEHSRYGLSHLQLDIDKKVLVATDGKIIVVEGVADFVEASDKTCLVPADAMRAAQKLATRKNKEPINVQPRDGGVIAVQLAGKDRHFFYTGNELFPDWDAILPNSDKGYSSLIAIDPSLLKRIEECLSKRNSRAGIFLHVKDRESAIVVSTYEESTNQFAMVMPMRGTARFPSKFWVTDKKAAKKGKAA